MLRVSHHHAQASSPNVPGPTLAGDAQIDQTLQEPRAKARSVWVALVQARHDLIMEVQRLRTSRQEQVPDCVEVLSNMFRKFSVDVLWSQHMRSAAAAVALSTSTAPAHLTELTGDDRMQSESIPTYTGYLEAPRKSGMDIMHAHGIMHAVGQVMVSSPAAGGAIKLHSQVPRSVGGGTGEVQRQRVLKESTSNVECTQEEEEEEDVVKRAAAQDDAPRSPSEGLLHSNNLNDLTWQKVCLKLGLPSRKYVCAVPIRPHSHVVLCSLKRSTWTQ
jgi:hypothetical protein